MSAPAPSLRLSNLAAELKALATGHWQMFRQEMSGKVTHTRRQTLWIAVGVIIALTAILLLLSGITLLISQALVTHAGWPPLTAGGLSALAVALLFALTGFLFFRHGGANLRSATFTPGRTLDSLKIAASALTNQPLIPNTKSPPMNTRQSVTNALNQTADTVEYQARRAGRAVQDTAQSLSRNFDPGAFFSAALAWVDTVLTPGNRAIAGKALGTATSLTRRHPVPAAILGLGALYVAWQRAKGTPPRDTVEDYVQAAAGSVKERFDDTRRYAANSFSAAASAGRDLRGTAYHTMDDLAGHTRSAASEFGKATSATAEAVRDAYATARESMSETAERAAETARQLRHDAEAGFRKAKEFAKDEPALAVAGGVALVLGALLLVKSSRR